MCTSSHQTSWEMYAVVFLAWEVMTFGPKRARLAYLLRYLNFLGAVVAILSFLLVTKRREWCIPILLFQSFYTNATC